MKFGDTGYLQINLSSHRTRTEVLQYSERTVPCTLFMKSYKCLVVQGVVAGSEYVSSVGQPRPRGAGLFLEDARQAQGLR